MKETFDVLLSGGGLDSAAYIALEHSNLDTILVVDYGQTMFLQEATATVAVATALGFKSDQVNGTSVAPEMIASFNRNSLLLGLGNEPFIRGRNLLLAQAAVAFYLGIAIALRRRLVIHFGFCHEKMMFSDADPHFVSTLDTLMRVAYGKYEDTLKPAVSVRAKYIHKTSKLDYLSRAVKATSEDVVFHKSFTCWTPKDGAECGQCYHCKKKADLLAQLKEDAAS